MKSYLPLPPTETLWELFSYNPLTGELHNRTTRCSTAREDEVAGTLHPDEGREIQLGTHKYKMHRLVYKWFTGVDEPTLMVDHINQNRLDNRIHNLRLATRGVNRRNSKNSGVYYRAPHGNTRGRWVASYQVDKKRTSRSFQTREEALEWRKNQLREHQ